MGSDDLKGVFDQLVRHAEHIVSRDELEERLREGRPLRVKLGLDPTAADVTLGWAVPLRKLRQFQDAGHTAVLIVGDFTARIGDPSDRKTTRPQLAADEVRAHADAVLGQFKDILSADHLEIRYNSEWHDKMDLPEVLRLTSHYTVARMLERDDFAKRWAAQQPISMVEFMYPLLQGYDSVAVESDVELGGTDQLFNLLVGRDLQRAYGQRPQIALTMPLIVGTDGVRKMSQSFGNYVAIRDAPEDMFGKLMRVPDEAIGQYAALTTNMTDEEIGRVQTAAVEGGPGAAEAKRRVAREVVRIYHGDEAARTAEAAFDRLFRERQAPKEIPVVAIPPSAIDGEVAYVPRILVEVGLAGSRSEARRLIEGRGVRIDGEPATSEEVPLAELRGAVLQVGKRRFVRLTTE
jgi:tyrosyl-tRNA synthetase